MSFVHNGIALCRVLHLHAPSPVLLHSRLPNFPLIMLSQQRSVVGHFPYKCPIKFSLSRHFDKLKLIGHQTDPLPQRS